MKPVFDKTKNKKLATLFLMTVFLVGTIFLAALPLYKKVRSAKDNLARENLNLENLIKEGSKVEKYQELEEKMKINSQTIDEAIVRKGNEIELIRRIEEVIGNLNIKTEIAAYAPPKKRGVATEAPAAPAVATSAGVVAETSAEESKASYFMISIIGTYPQFLNFLYKLENLSLIVKIESIKTISLSQFELENLKKDQATDETLPTLKSDILISYTPQ